MLNRALYLFQRNWALDAMEWAQEPNEVRDFHQQWDRLIFQDGVLFRMFQDILTVGQAEQPLLNVLVIIDHFTKLAWAVTARILWRYVILPFGCPSRFHSDQGANFEAALIQELCCMYGMQKSYYSLPPCWEWRLQEI